MMKPLLIATAAGVCGLAIGGAIGYKIADRNLALRFEERLLKETEDMRVFYTAVKKPFATPQEAVADLVSEDDKAAIEEAKEEELADVLHNVAYHKMATKLYKPQDEMEPKVEKPRDFGPPQPVIEQNLFSTLPYIITQETFLENDSKFNQTTLTYYVDDEVLADERDDVIEDKDTVVGLENLKLFGQDSSDENTVHIRNAKLEIEFEILRHEGSYSMEINGIAPLTGQRPSGRDR